LLIPRHQLVPHCSVVADGVEIRVLIWRTQRRSRGPLVLLVLLEVREHVYFIPYSIATSHQSLRGRIGAYLACLH
jgi:hypothetical protein